MKGSSDGTFSQRVGGWGEEEDVDIKAEETPLNYVLQNLELLVQSGTS